MVFEIKFKMLSLPLFPYLYDLHFNRKLLDEANVEIFSSCKNILKKTLTDIIEGKTWSAFIILLHQYLSNFCNLIEKFDEKEYPVKVYKTLIEARWGELKEFEKYYDELKKFLDYFCNWNHKYNLKDQEVALRELFSQTGLNLYIFQPLNNYVQTCSIDKIAGHIDDQLLKTHSLPVVTYFRGIDANIIEEIQKFNALEKKNCKLFDKFFNENSNHCC